MGWTRRTMLGAGVAAGLAPALSILATPGSAAAQTAPALKVRRDVGTMSFRNAPDDDPDLVALARAIRLMRDRPADDPLSWEAQVALHAGDWGQHQSWRFLPWHRCQLHWFEAIVARLSGKADFAMPYWNWQTTSRLPTLFLDPSSPFYHPARSPGLETVDFVRRRDELVFRGQSRWGRLDGPLLAVIGDPDNWGAVESSGHGYVHVTVGGDMSDPATAPRDPLFWFHHCNVDRIFAGLHLQWTQQGVAYPDDWTGLSFDMFNGPDGPGEPLSTDRVLATQSLGYEYDRPDPPIFFDTQIARPVGKTNRSPPVTSTPIRLMMTMEPGLSGPVRLALPGDLVATLAGDREALTYALSGVGSVRTPEPHPNGAAFTVAIERFPDEEPATVRPVATMIPFVGQHSHHGAMAGPEAAAMAPPAKAPDAKGPDAKGQPPKAPPPKTHGGLFAIDRELMNAAQADPRPLEVAVTVNSVWLDGRGGPAPSISSVELDLTLTTYTWS